MRRAPWDFGSWLRFAAPERSPSETRPGSTVAISSSAASVALIAPVLSHQRANASLAPSRAVESASVSGAALAVWLGSVASRASAIIAAAARGTRPRAARSRRRRGASHRRARARRSRSPSTKAKKARTPSRSASAGAPARTTLRRPSQHRLARGLHAGDIEAVLVAEVRIEQRLGHAHAGSDIIHRDCAKAAFGEQARAVSRICELALRAGKSTSRRVRSIHRQ